MPSLFRHYPVAPQADECQSAFVILCNAHDASSSFLDIFRSVRRGRRARGIPTDEEQDLLRAMLSFSTAGLDSMVKQLIKDALPTIIDHSPGAVVMFKSFILKRLGSGEDFDHKILADVLGESSPRQQLISLLLDDLTSHSLQSTEEILRTGAYFDIPSQSICQHPARLSEIFRVRNQIVHEMDVDFSQRNRNRRPRARQRMVNFTNDIFEVCNSFLVEVDRRANNANPE